VVATNTNDWCDREAEQLQLMQVQCLKLVTTLTLNERTMRAATEKPPHTNLELQVIRRAVNIKL